MSNAVVVLNENLIDVMINEKFITNELYNEQQIILMNQGQEVNEIMLPCVGLSKIVMDIPIACWLK